MEIICKFKKFHLRAVGFSFATHDFTIVLYQWKVFKKLIILYISNLLSHDNGQFTLHLA